MGYGYGIQRASEVLRLLSTKEEIGKRLNSAMLELGGIVYENINNRDVLEEEFDKIQDLKNEYNQVINEKIVNSKELELELEKLTEELTTLCCRIIKHNSIQVERSFRPNKID